MHQAPDNTPATGGDGAASALLRALDELSAEMHPGQKRKAATLDSSLDRDLGLDSLARVELLARIERQFGVKLHEQMFVAAETPRDLLQSVMSAAPAATGAAREVTRLELGEAEAPATAATLVDVVNWHVQRHPDRPHVQLYSDEQGTDIVTYGALRQGSEAVARGLQSLGLLPGDRVAIMLPTGREYFYSFMGILLAGGVPVPIYPPVRLSQIEDHLRRHAAILNNCAAIAMITIPEAKKVGRLLMSQVASMRAIVTVDDLGSKGDAYHEPVLKSDDIAFLQYTSGSTGNPKGVVLSHANLLANIQAITEAFRIDDTDVVVSWLPLYHDMGLIGVWMCSLYNALPATIMSPLDFISRPQRWLWAIHQNRGTLSAAPNFAYELCLRRLKDSDLDGLDLSSWRLTCNGAEPVSPEVVDGFCERFGRYGFRREAMAPVYGLAECSVGLAFPPLGRGVVVDNIKRDPFMRTGHAEIAEGDDDNVLRFVACGRPLPRHEIRIVDEKGRELPERREGRLQFRGPSASSGYFRNPEATEGLLEGDWLNSGDMAYIAGADVFITGRSKDIIIRAGRNIYPHELEEAVSNVAGIRKGNVVAFGNNDPRSGTERLVVVAETRERDAAVLERMRNEINALASDLVGTPADDIVLAPPGSLLKTSSGKVRRAATRDRYERGQIGKGHAAAWIQVARFAVSGIGPELRRRARNLGAALYAGYSMAIFLLVTLIAWIPAAVLPRLTWRWAAVHRAGRFFQIASFTKVTLQGMDKLPRGRAYLIVSNHASILDSHTLATVLPGVVRFVAKSELAKGWFLRYGLSRIGTEFVERFDKQKGVEDARRIGRAARDGDSPLIFYPEGGTARMPGLRPFHMGAFVVAVDADVPVVPVAIRGTRSILRSGSWFPRRGSITVIVGDPIPPGSVKDPASDDTWTTATRLRDTCREFILHHCGEPDLLQENAPL